MSPSPAPWLGFGLAVAGWAVIHFVWQAAVIGALVEGALRALRRASPITRERVAAAGVVLLMVVFAATGIGIVGDALDRGPASLGGAIETNRAMLALNTAAPWIGLAWILAVEWFLLRLARGFVRLRRMRAAALETLDPALQAMLRRGAARMGVRRPVELRISDQVEVPALIGWRRPAIVLPARALADLPAEGIEAVLMHELAHVRRGDAAAIVVQRIVGVTLSAHPAVRRVMACIDHEREQACDDRVLDAGAAPLSYARALARLERLRRGEASLALAAGGGALLERVRRIVTPSPRLSRRGAWAALAAIVLVLAAARVSVRAADARALVIPEVHTPFSHDPHDPDSHGAHR